MWQEKIGAEVRSDFTIAASSSAAQPKLQLLLQNFANRRSRGSPAGPARGVAERGSAAARAAGGADALGGRAPRRAPGGGEEVE